jgi:hypothetical protein
MNLACKAEADMAKLRSYTGESKRFTFEKYITGHKDCHDNVFDGLVQLLEDTLLQAPSLQRVFQ